MPIYEYRCAGCGHELEAIQKISDAPLVVCPRCGAHRLRKKISPVAFRLKGGGWYETDFKSGQQKNLAAAEDGGKDKAGGEGEKAAAAAGKGEAAGNGKQGGEKAAGSGEGATAAPKGDAPKAASE